MPKKTQNQRPGKWDERKLPKGVKLVRALEGHVDIVSSVVFDATGRRLASGSHDGTVKLWDVSAGKLLDTLEARSESRVFSVAFDPSGGTLASAGFRCSPNLWETASGEVRSLSLPWDSVVNCVAFDPTGRTLATGDDEYSVKLWDVASGEVVRTLSGHNGIVFGVAFDPTGRTLASGSTDRTVKVWEAGSGNLLRTLEAHEDVASSVAFDPAGRMIASGSVDNTIKLWDSISGKLLRTLEGHTASVHAVAFSPDGRVLASRSSDETLRLWSCETWETVVVIPEPRASSLWIACLAFHPTLPLIATDASYPGAKEGEQSRLIHLWELDVDKLLDKASEAKAALQAVHHTTAKIVLVGDSGVGKTGLGWRLAHGEFKDQASTHGQQFWVLNELGKRRGDGTECDAILWDLAGQPDYRLTHALFLDDSDLALILFDPTDSRDPLHGVEFWLKQLRKSSLSPLSPQQTKSERNQSACPMILIGARADRGDSRLTQTELDMFCRQRGIVGGYLATSAKDNIGLRELVQRMQAQIPWNEKAATVTTVTFKRIKDYVLGLKESHRQRKVIVTSQDLRKRLEKTDANWQFTDPEMMTAVKHLANYGYVRVLRTSESEERILLAPELLNNLAASFVLEARRNPKGLGSLEERRLLAGEYSFSEVEGLSPVEQDVLLDAAALLFLEHNVCFRETDPLGRKSYLVFPELINLKKPSLEDAKPVEEGVTYSVSGAVENVYSSLVVLLGYTPMFTRTNQWRNEARYEVADGLVCGFRHDDELDGEMDIVLYFGANVGQPVRILFQGLVESFLARRNLSVFRYQPVVCGKCENPLDRILARERLRDGKDFAFCPECGEKLALPKADESIQLTRNEQRMVNQQRWFADQRSRFEQALFQLASYVVTRKLARSRCFISHARGDREHERWVERNLATDLKKAGVDVLLDRWEYARVGSSMSRFVEHMRACDHIIVVGTPLYRRKYEGQDTSTSYVVEAEMGLIESRALGTEAEKRTVLPLLLAGEAQMSLPPLLHGHDYADFRVARDYFTTAFDLVLSLYGLALNDRAVADLRSSLLETLV